MIKPLKLITELKKADRYIEIIFTEGGCYQFHLFLKKLFPNAVPYINQTKDHIVTAIDGTLYDITGVIAAFEGHPIYQHQFDRIYEPLKSKDVPMAKGWNFGKNNMLSVGECPACEEPICV